MYALVRLVSDPTVDVVGISSAHFNNSDLVAFKKWNQYNTGKINTVKISQALNQHLLKVMGRLNIAHPIGADRQIGRAWGGAEARPSPASKQIIAAISQLGKNEKLVVICLGALTNIASAIMEDTAIVRHLTCYALGAQYDLTKKCWNKNEFNIRNDLNAFDYLLNNKGVDLVVMPINVAYPYRFSRDSLYAIFNSRGVVHQLLKTRWQETNPQDAVRTLWDLALVEAFLNSEYTTTTQVLTPPENSARLVKIYSSIDVLRMKADFISVLENMPDKFILN